MRQFLSIGVDDATAPSLPLFAAEQRGGVQAETQRLGLRARVAGDQGPGGAIMRPTHEPIGRALVGTPAHEARVDHVRVAGFRPAVDRDERLPLVR